MSGPDTESILSRRPFLGVLAVLVLAVAIASGPQSTVGMLSGWTITGAILAGLFLLTACVLKERTWRLRAVWTRMPVIGAGLFLALHVPFYLYDRDDQTAAWVKGVVAGTAVIVVVTTALRRAAPASFAAALPGAAALLLTGEAVFCTDLNPEVEPFWVDAMNTAALAGFLLTATLLLHLPGVRWRRLFAAQVVLVFVAGLVLRFGAAVASPNPGIDLYFAQQSGGDYLLAGRDPYGAPYCDYGAPFYPPLPLLAGAVCRFADMDVRVGLAFGDMVAAVALLAAARGRGSPLSAALLAAAYLHFPRVPLIMELGWYEPLVAAFLGLGLALVGRGYRLGYLFLGVGLTGKQYTVVCFPALLRAAAGRRFSLVLGVGLAVAVVVLPFYLWEPAAFRESVVAYHLGLPMRPDGVTLQAVVLYGCKWTLNRHVMLVAAARLIGVLAWRTPTDGSSPAAWMAAALVVFCLFHTQAFLNYYYLAEYLLLFGLADWFAAESS